MLSAYARFIVRHSYLILLIISIIATILTIIPLVCHTLPSFSDPLVGFETRGTTLAHRFIAWENLIDESRPSRKLAVNPKDIEDQIRMNQTYNSHVKDIKSKTARHRLKHKHRKKIRNNNTGVVKTLYVSPESNISDNHVHWGYGKNVSYEDEHTHILKDVTRKQWLTLKEMKTNRDNIIPVNYASGSCGPPVADYAHLVVTSSNNVSLLMYENVVSMCNMQSFLVELGEGEYYNLCERSTHSKDQCCPVWSIPNYIALLSNKDSCENLTREDVNNSIRILKKCAGYFHNFTLMATCDLHRCNVPKYCSQYDAVYNLLFYIIDSHAFSPDGSGEFVKNAMIFLPLPYSINTLPYYTKLQKTNSSYDSLAIPALDFGLKNALFDEMLIEDTWLIGLGGVFVFLGVWFYTKSLILTLLLFTAIAYSLGIAYFLYLYVFNLEYFPFMNLLVIVVVIGIGADDAFLYVKIWNTVSKQLIRDNIVTQENDINDIKNVSSAGETILVQILEETLKHSGVTIFVTTLTTSVAFLASYVSYIPAINCFGVFAGTSVLVNFFLMMTWLPVSVYIVDVKLCSCKVKPPEIFYKSLIEGWENLVIILNRIIITCVMKMYLFNVIVFGAIGIGSLVVVFYSPGLQLPESKQFQLFQTNHPVEQYDISFKDNFLFERLSKDVSAGMKMPLRWIWGVKAIDNGNHMNPYSYGHLVLDNEFSISDPESQVWLLNFCMRLKSQPFYQHTLGPLLPNCFIESFKMYMSRRCIDKIDKINRTPCCETSLFPYSKAVFDFCIIKAMESMYLTPRELFIPGVAGPKFLRSVSPPPVVAIVVEFESVVSYTMSYSEINNFFLQVENWTQAELKSAPPGMSGGWFLSDLQFYDLQRTLARGTVIALLLSASLGFVVLIPATLNFAVSVSALTSMIFSSTVTIAILVLYNWKLNVLESVAISTSAGLAVDFNLHYALSYTNSSGSKSNRVKYALTTSAGPTVAAALTTGFAGIFLLRSNLLPYSQIGKFLALIMSISWVYATFFLCSLLHIVGANSLKEAPIEERKSGSRVSSICSGVPNLESHELEHLADSNRTNLTHSQSPSSVSATTVVLHDETDNTHNRIENNSGINIVFDKD